MVVGSILASGVFNITLLNCIDPYFPQSLPPSELATSAVHIGDLERAARDRGRGEEADYWHCVLALVKEQLAAKTEAGPKRSYGIIGKGDFFGVKTSYPTSPRCGSRRVW